MKMKENKEFFYLCLGLHNNCRKFCALSCFYLFLDNIYFMALFGWGFFSYFHVKLTHKKGNFLNDVILNEDDRYKDKETRKSGKTN